MQEDIKWTQANSEAVVLVVEVDLILRFITVKFLEELGFGIIEAKDATAAWANRVEKITFGDYGHKVEILVCRSQTQQPTGSSTPKACMNPPLPQRSAS